MTQNSTADRSGPSTGRARLTRTPAFAAALLLAPAFLSQPQHVAEGEGARVTTLWRSERALDRYAKEGLSIAAAVLKEVGARPDDAPLVSVGVAESPLALRWLEDPSTKKLDLKARRARRQARRQAQAEKKAAGPAGAEGGSDAQPEQAPSSGPNQVLEDDLGDLGALMVAPGLLGKSPGEALENTAAGRAVVALAPKVHDRTMFASGLTPATRWALALEVARAADPGGDLLGHALGGMQAAGWAYPLEIEPYVATGLMGYQQSLQALPAADGGDLPLAAWELPARQTFDPYGPIAAPMELVARHCRAAGLTKAQVLDLQPKWFVEAGAVAKHSFGWQAVASRRADALALTVEPRTSEPFTMKTTVVLLSNDLKAPAQADFAFGDVDGARYLLICNTRHGIYFFRRSTRGGDYVIISETKEIAIPAGRPFEVTVTWADHTLVATVGGAEMPGVVLPEDAMTGRFGFGCHAGTTALFSGVTFE